MRQVAFLDDKLNHSLDSNVGYLKEIADVRFNGLQKLFDFIDNGGFLDWSQDAVLPLPVQCNDILLDLFLCHVVFDGK